MLLGYAAGQDGAAWENIEPYGEIGGLEAAALGPLAVLLERLDDTWRLLRESATVNEWCIRLRALKDAFFAADVADAAAAAADAYTLSRLDAALDAWQDACDEAAFTEKLPLSVVAEQWLASLDTGGLAQRFFGGTVTFATLMPMRAIPFRHVYLLGMNDGDYPRTRNPIDFDLMAREYRPGDRSRREDDRYLFLEALLSARERLHVSWVGRSVNDNSERPASVLIGQLRDHLKSGWTLASREGAGAKAGFDPGKVLLAALTTEHPLQAFSPAYFPPRTAATPGSPPGPGELFTYAREWQSAATPAKVAKAAGARLPPQLRDEPLTLRTLSDFLADPVKAFFTQRLSVYFEAEDPATDDVEPFELDALARWKLQDELIRAETDALARGEDGLARRNATIEAIGRRGELAPGAFGERLAAELLTPMDRLFANYAKAVMRWPDALDSEVELRFEQMVGNTRVEVADWLGGVLRKAAAPGAARAAAEVEGEGEDSRFGYVALDASALVDDKKKYRGDKIVRHWVRHLALHVAVGPLTTVVVSKKGVIELGPRDPAEARARLEEIVAAWHEGMRRPLPLAARSGFAWLRAFRSPATDLDKAQEAARSTYEPGFNYHGECADSAYLSRAWPSFDALWAGGEFRELAERLLRPLQQAIHVKAETESAEGAPE